MLASFLSNLAGISSQRSRSFPGIVYIPLPHACISTGYYRIISYQEISPLRLESFRNYKLLTFLVISLMVEFQTLWVVSLDLATCKDVLLWFIQTLF